MVYDIYLDWKRKKVMKKFLIAATAAAMLMTTGTPAKAGSDWVGPAILGTIFGVIIDRLKCKMW